MQKIREKASKGKEMERNREKSGNMARISEREQRRSPGQISKRHGIPERKVMRHTTIQANIQCRVGGGKSRVTKGGVCTIC